MVRELKISSEDFQAILDGNLAYILQREDGRCFEVGDVFLLREWVGREWIQRSVDEGRANIADVLRAMRGDEPDFTGRACRVRVTHILRDSLCLRFGAVALSIRLEGQ
ncbi:MAG: hypothetical protein C7B45_03530 [Sulfobacillus acidophilus]|uniref:DUF3850 domain-containing protein n=1 Tax=Sulfobacillus acidophilus TaxID=53633 RepID=A0A2T2WMC4_9FIRM|nr:MAG: hypothetical protein C7B45_03530 [Sulfobacillus acidophilus]